MPRNPWHKTKRYKPQPDSVALFVAAIKRAGPHRNLVDELFDPLRVQLALDPENASLGPLAGLQGAIPRRAPPFATAAELCALWPMICKGLLGFERTPSITPEKLAVRFKALGWDPVPDAEGLGGFRRHGALRVYYWTVKPVSNRPLTTEQFERILALSFQEG